MGRGKKTELFPAKQIYRLPSTGQNRPSRFAQCLEHQPGTA